MNSISWLVNVPTNNASAFGIGIIDLLATGKSRYFAQPLPIIDHYFHIKLIIIEASE